MTILNKYYKPYDKPIFQFKHSGWQRSVSRHLEETHKSWEYRLSQPPTLMQAKLQATTQARQTEVSFTSATSTNWNLVCNLSVSEQKRCSAPLKHCAGNHWESFNSTEQDKLKLVSWAGEGGKRDVGTDVKTYLHTFPGPKHGRREVTVYSEHLDSVVQFCERDTSTIGQHLSGEKSQRQVWKHHVS